MQKIKLLQSKQFLIPLLLLVVFVFFVAFATWQVRQSENKLLIVRDFQDVLNQKTNKVLQAFRFFKQQSDRNYWQLDILDKYYNFDQDEIVLFVFEGDTLKYWSSSAVPIANTLSGNDFECDILKLKNGWYRVVREDYGTQTFVGLILIKYDFYYENQYLVDRFAKAFKCNKSIGLSTDTLENNVIYLIKTIDGKPIFRLDFSNFKPQVSHVLIITIFFIWLILSALLLLATSKFSKNSLLGLMIGILLLFIVRYISLIYKIPHWAYEHELFDPKYFSSSLFLPSLADFLLNALLILQIAIAINHWKPKKHFTKKTFFLFYFVGLWLTIAYSLLVYKSIVDLILNSTIDFNLLNVFQLNWSSLIGLLIIALLQTSLFLFVHRFLKIYAEQQAFLQTNMLYLNSLNALLALVIFYFAKIDLTLLLWLATILLIVFHAIKQKIYTFYHIFALLVLFAGYLTFYTNVEVSKKEHEHRVLLGTKIAVQTDPIVEYLFEATQRKVLSDSLLNRYLFNHKEITYQPFFNRLFQKYFNGYWERYALYAEVFSPIDYLTLSDSSKHQSKSLKNFENLIANNANNTSINNLYAIETINGSLSYLIKFTFRNHFSPLETKIVFVQLTAKTVQERSGFPELLLDKKVNRPVNISDYDFAHYNKARLITHKGNYAYPQFLPFLSKIQADTWFVNHNNYNHLIYKVDHDNTIILSKVLPTWFEQFSPFAYVLVIFSLIAVVIVIVNHFVYKQERYIFNLQRKIQLTTIAILLFSLVLVGFISTYFIIKQFDTKNKIDIREKMNSILLEIEEKTYQIKKLEKYNDLQDFFNYQLSKLSNIYFTDIHIFNERGEIYASSVPAIFEEALISKYMSPKAFSMLVKQAKVEYLDTESIGQLNYLSLYRPIKNNENHILGYINLPYFAKQNTLEKEVSSFLVSLINVYLLLIVVSVLLTIFIANQLTKPLQLIVNKLKQIKLGTKNEYIDWQKNDEIGQLILEYNKMVNTLEKSALKLAESERELAWRQMAKQVAHELKNPLTPMKLKVQHLQRLWHDKSPKFNEAIDQLTEALVEQIDILSNIANAFSDFAQMPKTILEPVDLQKVLLNVVKIYQTDDFQAVKIIYNANTSLPCFTNADKEQLVRVFNNLIKNAVQALELNKEGIIEVNLNAQKDKLIVEIKDNGNGIDEQMKDKIFLPNFTTKTTGSGLGLAISKSIIENIGGKIWFHSVKGSGTSFFVQLKKNQE